MIEKPLERLNYYNGQRLEASDLKLEQDYHIRVRRWLNRALYSPGIARGLEVRAEKGTRNVVIGPGLALDAEGHEIILLEEAHEIVPGRGRQRAGAGSEAEVEGLYLTIRYDEQTVAEERGVCFARASGDDAGRSRPAPGGPARISARPVFNWRAFLPHESSGEIVLAQVELDKNCTKVHQVNVGVRRYVGAASGAKVRQYALDGDKHIDPDNPGRIYFHIRGRQPNSVILYLRAEHFSTLFYTELGHHDHAIDVKVNSVTIPGHSHTITPDPATGGTGEAGDHKHDFSDVRARIAGVLNTPPPASQWAFGPFDFISGREASLSIWASLRFIWLLGGKHSHSIPSSTDPEPAKSIALSGGGSSQAAGVTDKDARSGSAEQALTYVDDLQVLIGPNINNLVNYTQDILWQLRAASAVQDWGKLGGGPLAPNHALIEKGTGPIRLDFLPGLAFTEGEYVIQLQVMSGGGRILYNLYVE